MDGRSSEPLNPAQAKARLRAAAARAEPLVWLGRHPVGVAAAGFAAGFLSALSHRGLGRLAGWVPRGVLLALGGAFDVQRARRLLDEQQQRQSRSVGR